MLAPIVIISAILLCAVVSLWRPHVGVTAFYFTLLLKPEWNWRWTTLQDFKHQDLLAISTLLGTLMTFGRGNRPTWAVKISYGALFAFIALAFLSHMQSINPLASWFYLDVLWKAILMSTLACFHLDTPQKIMIFMWAIVLGQGYNAYELNLQYFEDGYSRYVFNAKWAGISSNGNSLLVMPIIACSGALAIYSRKWWSRCLAGTIAVLQIHQIMFLESRGCMLGGVAMGVVFAANMPRSRNAYVALGVLLICGSILAGPSVVEEFKSSFADAEELDASAQSRFELWKSGWRITVDHWLLGVGPNCGRYFVHNYWEDTSENKALHNLFFEISTGCGLLAAILYVGHFVVAWVAIVITYRWRRNSRPRGHLLEAPMLAVVAGQIGYWIGSMFSSGALFESSYSCMAIGAAALCVHIRLFPHSPPKTYRHAAPVASTAPAFGKQHA